MKKLFFGFVLLAFIGCGQKNWTKEDARKKCLEDANKDKESKDMPEDLKNKVCDCWAEKAIVKYKSAAAADKDSTSTAYKEMVFSCIWNKEFVAPLFIDKFKSEKELKALGDDNINKIANCVAEKAVAKFKSIAEVENNEDAIKKIGEDCTNEIIWNKESLKRMLLVQFKKESKMESVGNDTLNKIADCVADKMLSKYKSLSEAKMDAADDDELTSSCVSEFLGEEEGGE
jgi:hypothetical protein